MALEQKRKGQNRKAKGIIGSSDKKAKKPLSYNEATGGKTTKGKAGYKKFTEDEREDWKVAHGIAPTSEDPSAIGQATREAAKAAHARGELSDKDRRAQGIVEVRELDEAKYNAMLESARTARSNISDITSKKTHGSQIFSSSPEQGVDSGDTSSPVAGVASKVRGRIKNRRSKLDSSGFEGAVFSANLMPNTGDNQ